MEIWKVGQANGIAVAQKDYSNLVDEAMPPDSGWTSDFKRTRTGIQGAFPSFTAGLLSIERCMVRLYSAR